MWKFKIYKVKIKYQKIYDNNEKKIKIFNQKNSLV